VGLPDISAGSVAFRLRRKFHLGAIPQLPFSSSAHQHSRRGVWTLPSSFCCWAWRACRWTGSRTHTCAYAPANYSSPFVAVAVGRTDDDGLTRRQTVDVCNDERCLTHSPFRAPGSLCWFPPPSTPSAACACGTFTAFSSTASPVCATHRASRTNHCCCTCCSVYAHLRAFPALPGLRMRAFDDIHSSAVAGAWCVPSRFCRASRPGLTRLRTFVLLPRLVDRHYQHGTTTHAHSLRVRAAICGSIFLHILEDRAPFGCLLPLRGLTCHLVCCFVLRLVRGVSCALSLLPLLLLRAGETCLNLPASRRQQLRRAPPHTIHATTLCRYYLGCTYCERQRGWLCALTKRFQRYAQNGRRRLLRLGLLVGCIFSSVSAWQHATMEAGWNFLPGTRDRMVWWRCGMLLP